MAPANPVDDRLDPSAAWRPWEPTAAEPWSLKWAGHLYRRAGFGGTPEQVTQAVADGLPAAVEKLLNGTSSADRDEAFARTGEVLADQNVGALRGWWLYLMLNGGHPLREKLTLFWHNHFATSIAKVRAAPLMFRQNQTLRRHALGSFAGLLADVSRDPAMVVWLDNNRNLRGRPNENYAREVMELFTLGVGHYTERDVREAARAFTGWHTDGPVFAFNPRYHDDGPKTVLGATGPWDGTDVQRLILDRPEVSRFLVAKVYRDFVSETKPPAGLLEPLAERYRQSRYDTRDLISTVLRSRHFYSEHAYRRRVKSPVEYAVGAVQGLGIERIRPEDLVDPLEKMGQALFAPPDVKGWRGGKHWLNSATVLARQNFAEQVVKYNETPDRVGAARLAVKDPNPAPAPRSLLARLRDLPGATARGRLSLAADALLGGDLDEASRGKLEHFLEDGNPKDAALEARLRETVHAALSLPDYHLA